MRPHFSIFLPHTPKIFYDYDKDETYRVVDVQYNGKKKKDGSVVCNYLAASVELVQDDNGELVIPPTSLVGDCEEKGTHPKPQKVKPKPRTENRAPQTKRERTPKLFYSLDR